MTLEELKNALANMATILEAMKVQQLTLADETMAHIEARDDLIAERDNLEDEVNVLNATIEDLEAELADCQGGGGDPDPVPSEFDLGNHLGWKPMPGGVSNDVAVFDQNLKYRGRKIAMENGFKQAFNNIPPPSNHIYSTIWQLAPEGTVVFKEVADGKWDQEITDLMKAWIKNGHGNAILRLYHEPDLAKRQWYKDPDYSRAWKHVKDIVSALPGANFEWNLSLNGPAGSSDDILAQCYPGDFVDSISVSRYHRLGAGSASVEESRAAARNRFNRVLNFAVDRNKVFNCLEWGQDLVKGGYGDDEVFIEETIEDFAAIPENLRGVLLYFEFRGGRNALVPHAGTNSPGLPKSLAKIKEYL